jgi:hypothetical protein
MQSDEKRYTQMIKICTFVNLRLTSRKTRPIFSQSSSSADCTDYAMISRSTQCLVFLCLVLVWDFTAVRMRESRAQKKRVTISVCKALPISMRNRQQIDAQIDLAQLPAGISSNVRWLAEEGLPEFMPRVTLRDWGGHDLLYRLKSLQR